MLTTDGAESTDTIPGLAPDTILEVRTITDANGTGHCRAIALDAQVVIYLPSIRLTAGEYSQLLKRDKEE